MSNRTTPPAKQANHTNQRPVPVEPAKKAHDLVKFASAQIKQVLPEHIGAGRFLRVIALELAHNPQLLECTTDSVISCMLEMAKLGLEPGAYGGCHLIPYRDNKKNISVATLVTDYRGIVDLARRSGDVQTVQTQIVYKKDKFSVNSEGINHEFDPFESDRGKPIGAYCIFTLKDGGKQFEVMSCKQIDDIRNASPGKNSPSWKNHWEEMARKTVLRRASKMIRLSPEAVDNGVVKPQRIEFERQQDPARTLQHTQAKGIEQQRNETVPLDKLESGQSTHAAAMGE